MKKLVITLTVFLIFFFLIDKLFYWKIQSLPDSDFDKRLEWILQGKMNKDILLFGSSRAQHNLYSDAIQDSLSMSTFNLGYRGCNINFQLFLLKSVLKHNKKPKILFLTVDDDKEFFQEKTLQFRYDKLYPLVKHQEITNELISQHDISPFAVGLYSARIGWQQFSKPKSPTKFEKWTKTGTVLLDFSAADFDKKMKPARKYDANLELPERLQAFKEFQEICNKENIKLYILLPPNFIVQSNGFVNRINGLISNKKTEFWFNYPSMFKDSQYFYDPSHLNKKGTILYTNQIIQKIKNNP